MPKLPVLSGRKVIKALKKAGFKPKRQKGSHIIIVKETEDERIGVVIPDHKEIDTGTLLDIIRQSKLKKEDFIKLL